MRPATARRAPFRPAGPTAEQIEALERAMARQRARDRSADGIDQGGELPGQRRTTKRGDRG